jgi:hypothetical protein
MYNLPGKHSILRRTFSWHGLNAEMSLLLSWSYRLRLIVRSAYECPLMN